jgi:hypothetical protein
MAKQLMIKKDAKMSIEIGTLFFERLNELFAFIVSERTEEELARFQSLVDSGKEPDEVWMTSLQTLQVLISGFQESAEKSGQTYEVEADDTTQQDS